MGETSRTLAERSEEHVRGYRRSDTSNFMFKHWANCHPDLIDPPQFQFTVIKAYRDAMSRLVHEAVRIPKRASLNSKSEWGGYKLARLTVEKPEWEARKDIVEAEKVSSNEAFEMLKFKAKVIAAAQHSSINKNVVSCRKRRMDSAKDVSNVCTPVQDQTTRKRRRIAGISPLSESQGKFSRAMEGEAVTSTPVTQPKSASQPGDMSETPETHHTGLSSNPSDQELLLLAATQVDPSVTPDPLNAPSDGSDVVFLLTAVDEHHANVELSNSKESWLAALPHNPESLRSLSSKAFNRQVPTLMSLSRVVAAARLGLACDVSAVLPRRNPIDTVSSLPDVDRLIGTFTELHVDPEAELRHAASETVAVQDVNEKLEKLAIGGSTEIQDTPIIPNAIVTHSPDLSPKVPLFQDAVGACSSIGGTKTSNANNTGTAVSNAAECDNSLPPKVNVTTPEYSPKTSPPQGAVGACSSTGDVTSSYSNNTRPAASITAESPSQIAIPPPETSPVNGPTQGGIGACSATGSFRAVRQQSSSTSSSSGDDSVGRKLFPVFSSRNASLTSPAGKKLSRKLKKTRRASVVEASEQKQKLLTGYFAPGAIKKADIGHL